MKVKFKIEEIPEISKKILNKIIIIKNNKAKVLAFSGDLGVGKTTFTQEIGKFFGIKDKIISPTFVIIKFYNIDSNSKYYSFFKRLIHIDAYRLESSEELIKIGWKDLTEDKDNLIIIEWPEKVEDCLDSDSFWVKLKHINDQTRIIEF